MSCVTDDDAKGNVRQSIITPSSSLPLDFLAASFHLNGYAAKAASVGLKFGIYPKPAYLASTASLV